MVWLNLLRISNILSPARWTFADSRNMSMIPKSPFCIKLLATIMDFTVSVFKKI